LRTSLTYYGNAEWFSTVNTPKYVATFTDNWKPQRNIIYSREKYLFLHFY
jgi:hypothetical protein